MSRTSVETHVELVTLRAVAHPLALGANTYEGRQRSARKLWKAAGREALEVERDQVARLLPGAGIAGVRRTRRVKTTRPDPLEARHPDHAGRDFTTTAPNQLWVTNLTYVVRGRLRLLIIDSYSRMIVGWRAAPTMRTETVLAAIEMAGWSRGANLTGLRCHSDAGSQYTLVALRGMSCRDRSDPLDRNRG